MMGSCGGAALLCSLIIVGSGVASLLASTTAAVTSSHRAEGGERVAGNLDVCENRLMFARLQAAAAFCPRIDEFKDPVVKVQFSAPCEPPTLTSAGSVATTKAAAGANCNHRSFLQRILSRLLGRYRDMMPFRNSTAQDVGYRRVVVVMVTAGAIIAGLLIPYLVITNRKKRKLSGNESVDKRSHVGDCGWYAASDVPRFTVLRDEIGRTVGFVDGFLRVPLVYQSRCPVPCCQDNLGGNLIRQPTEPHCTSYLVN